MKKLLLAEPRRCSLSPRPRPLSPARSPPPISPRCGGSPRRRSRPTAIGRSISCARPTWRAIAAEPICGCSICAAPAPSRSGSPPRRSITSTIRASRPTAAGSIISATPRSSDQLWRVALPGGAPERVSELATDIAGFLIAPTGDRIALWADRDMRCADFNCANVSARRPPATAAAASMTRPSCATGTPGRRPASARASSPSRWSTAARRARARRSRANLVGDSPSKPFGGAEELAWSADGRTLYLHLARGRPHRAQLDQSRHLRGARRGRRVDNLTDVNRATDTTPPSRPTAAGSLTPPWRGRVTRPTGR